MWLNQESFKCVLYCQNGNGITKKATKNYVVHCLLYTYWLAMRTLASCSPRQELFYKEKQVKKYFIIPNSTWFVGDADFFMI